MTNLFTPFQRFAPAFHYLFTLCFSRKVQNVNMIQKTFSLFTGKNNRIIKMSVHNLPHITGAIKECLDGMAARKYSKKSIDTYEKGLNRFVLFVGSIGIERPQDVNRKQLDSFRLDLVDAGLADATIYLYLRSVRTFFSFLEENQQIFQNPAADLQLPKCQRKLGTVPSEKEMKKLLAQPNPATPVGLRDRTLLEVAYSCGLRKAELASLTIFDPDIKQGTIRIMGKGKKERVVPLGKQAIFWLRRYLEKTRPCLSKDINEHGLWIGKYGARLSYARIDKLIREYGAEANLSGKISAHGLRRACATHMLRGGAHPVEIQMLLGHANLASLSQYLQVTITDMKKMHKRSKPGR